MKRLTLGDVCKKESSNIAQKDLQDKKGAYPIYGASGLIKQVDFYQQDKEYIAVVKDGAGIGRTMLLPAYSSVIGTMQYLLPKEGIPIDIKYLFYAVEHMNLAKYFSGATIPHIYFRDYQKEPINIPDIETQRKISQIFGKIDALITSRKEQRTKLDQIVKSRFIEMFGDPLSNSKAWLCIKITDVCRAIFGGGTPAKSHPEYFTGVIPWVSPKDMKSSVINGSIDHITEEAIVHSTTNLVPAYSVLMVIRSGILKHTLPVAINSIPVAINQDMKAFVPNSVITPAFLMHYFKAIEPDVLAGVRSVTADNIDFKAFQKRRIIVPPMELQEQFAAFVEQTDKSKLAIQKSLEKLEILKKALMQKYFG